MSEGHQIGEYVRRQLVTKIDEVSDVTVHIDPEDDESSHLSEDLPLRREITARLRTHWQTLINPDLIQTLNFHYLSGKLHIEVILPLTAVEDIPSAQSLAQELREAVADWRDLDSVQIYFR